MCVAAAWRNSRVKGDFALDSHRVMFGGLPDQNENSPLVDDKVSREEKLHNFAYWVSGYYKHGDISTQNADVLSRVESPTTHPATVTNITADEQKEMICVGNESDYEIPCMISSQQQFAYAYREAFFGDNVRELFPGFKATFLAGELSPPFAIYAYWMLENDIKEAGKSFGLVLIPDSNHFVSLSTSFVRAPIIMPLTAPLGRSGKGPEDLS